MPQIVLLRKFIFKTKNGANQENKKYKCDTHHIANRWASLNKVK